MSDKRELLTHLVGVGMQVRTLKDNDALKIVLAALKRGILDDFATCDALDVEMMRHHRMRLHAVSEIEQSIDTLILHGENAAAEIRRDEEDEKLRKLQG